MYARSERKIALSKRTTDANPELGPGRYELDLECLQRASKRGTGYAPFASLARRVSTFDAQVSHNPAPGMYGAEGGKKSSKSAIFGISKARRFEDEEHISPGPSYYEVQELDAWLRKRSTWTQQQQQQPRAMHILASLKVAPAAVADDEDPVHSYKKQDLAKESSRKDKDNASQAHIQWQRKFVPPSIPYGRFASGYEETPDGQLVLRTPKVPKTPLNKVPVVGFVEEDTYRERGTAFGKSRVSRQSPFDPPKTSHGPGPGRYNVESSTLRRSQSAPQVPNRPCRPPLREDSLKNQVAQRHRADLDRFTAHVEAAAEKEAIPGPGAYEPKLQGTTRRVKAAMFGPASGRAQPQAITQTNEVAKTPGPATYHVEAAGVKKPQVPREKQRPFNCGTSRFEPDDIDVLLRPGPGFYAVEDHYSMTSNVKRKQQQLQLQNDVSPIRAVQRAKYANRKRSTAPTPPLPGPMDYVVEAPRSKTAAKASFASHTERFQITSNSLAVPAPGSYEVAKSHELLTDKGKYFSLYPLFVALHRVQPSGDGSSRPLFKMDPRLPGPTEYDPKVKSDIQTLRMIQNDAGTSAFVTRTPRFASRDEGVPAPNTYGDDEAKKPRMRKTFNVTFDPPKTGIAA